MSEQPYSVSPTAAENATLPDARGSRKWDLVVAVLAVVLFWSIYLALGMGETHMFARWLLRMGALLVTGLVLLVPWFAQREFSLKWRLAFVAIVIVGMGLPILLRDHTLMPVTPIEWSLEIFLSLAVVWLLISRRLDVGLKHAGYAAALLLSWIPGLIFRGEGLTGDGKYDLRWRWTPTSEEKFLASQQSKKISPPADAALKSNSKAGDKQASDSDDKPIATVEAEVAQPLVAVDGDWPAFRGPWGDSRIHGATIATDWAKSQPVEVWKHAVGLAWSSILVVGDRLFTQEQRGDVECTVCYSATSGEQLWSHDTTSRFEEPLAGVGPRATPTFRNGRIFSLGARGRLDAIDAVTGKLLWTRDALADNKATMPMWGFSVSPLVTDDHVIVFIGGTTQEALAAYDVADGKPAWKMAAGRQSYSSPELLKIHGVSQVLYLSDTKLVSVDPATGKLLWEFVNPAMGRPTCQPQLVDDSHLLVSFEPGSLLQIEVTKDGDTWAAKQTWKTIAIKPDFSDYLVHDGYVYGFDADIFCCVELATGKRKWKAGRYGAGQALLFADQGVILVLTEQGDLVLVPCDPKKHRELARSKAIEGKTWNHPSYSRGKLYVRNAEEMACIAVAKE